MKRNIISINEKQCNGCGNCILGCPEGALQVIDGKARLVSDLFCDGLGACIGECPTGAMHIEEREAEPYDEYKVMANVAKAGTNTIKAHLKHLDEHGETTFLNQAIDFLNKNNVEIPDYKEKAALACGCPGTMMKTIERKEQPAQSAPVNQQSELNTWPIQLMLLNPNAPYLKNADLVIAADCTAFAYPNFHQRFLKGRVLTLFCPKLDQTMDRYVDKLTEIFKNQDLKSITIVHMEVPCCGGIESVVRQALQRAEKNIIMKDYTISLAGEII